MWTIQWVYQSMMCDLPTPSLTLSPSQLRVWPLQTQMNPSAIRHLQGGIQWGQQNGHWLSLISNHLITSSNRLPPGAEEMWFLFSESHSHEQPSDKTHCLWTPCRMAAAAWTVGVIHIWQFFTYLFTFFSLQETEPESTDVIIHLHTSVYYPEGKIAF